MQPAGSISFNHRNDSAWFSEDFNLMVENPPKQIIPPLGTDKESATKPTLEQSEMEVPKTEQKAQELVQSPPNKQHPSNQPVTVAQNQQTTQTSPLVHSPKKNETIPGAHKDTLKTKESVEWSDITSSEVAGQTMPFENDSLDAKIRTSGTRSGSNSPTSQQRRSSPARSEKAKEILNRIQQQNIMVENSTDQQLLEFFKSYEQHHKDIIDVDALLDSESVQLKRYKNAVFLGQIINGHRNGPGIMLYNSGGSYEGGWKQNLRNGKGFELFSSGDRYEGLYVDGKMEGIGTYVWISGEIYDGEWKNGLRHGSGQWRSPSNDQYVGEWNLGKADGYGVKTMGNGDIFEGQFKEGLKHGDGVEKYTRGDKYIGKFANDKPEGEGEFTWSSGQTYKGAFKNGLKHGMGLWRKSKDEANCDRYEGHFVNDKKSGFGHFKWATGNMYSGNYFEDLRHGYGEMHWTDGTVYKGEWIKGDQGGEGKLFLNGVEIIQGQRQESQTELDLRLSQDSVLRISQDSKTAPISQPQKSKEGDLNGTSQLRPLSRPTVRSVTRNSSASRQKDKSSEIKQASIETVHQSPVKKENGKFYSIQQSVRSSVERSNHNTSSAAVIVSETLEPRTPEPKEKIRLPLIRNSENQRNWADKRLMIREYTKTETQDSSGRKSLRSRGNSTNQRYQSYLDFNNVPTDANSDSNKNGNYDPMNDTCHKKYPSFQIDTSTQAKKEQITLTSPAIRKLQQRTNTSSQVSPYVSDKITSLKGTNPFFMNNLSPLLHRLQQNPVSPYREQSDAAQMTSQSVLTNHNGSQSRRQPAAIFWSLQQTVEPQIVQKSISPQRETKQSQVSTQEKATCTRDFDDLPAYPKDETISEFPIMPPSDEKKQRQRSTKKATIPYGQKPLEIYELILWEKYRLKHLIPIKPYENINDPKVIAKIRAFLNPPIWKPSSLGISPETIKQKDIIDSRDVTARKSRSPSHSPKTRLYLMSPFI